MTVFEPINLMKAMKLNGAFSRLYARRLLGDPIVLSTLTPPHPPSFFIANLFFSFFEMKCRAVPTGRIGAAPVVSIISIAI